MQIFQENIPTPVVASTTTLTLATTNLGQPTRFNIGGQSYSPSALLTINTATTGANALDTGTLSAIALYYVYAIVNTSTFVPALVASLSPPSAGPLMPSGYGTAYKLVGAFYTNGSSQVASIVTITGTAKSGWMSYSAIVSNLGAGGTAATDGQWRRDGDTLQMTVRVVKDTTPGTGSVAVATSFPGSLTANTASIQSGSNLGTGTFSGATFLGATNAFTAGGLLFLRKVGASTSIFGSDMTANAELNFFVNVPIVGWNATLL